MRKTYGPVGVAAKYVHCSVYVSPALCSGVRLVLVKRRGDRPPVSKGRLRFSPSEDVLLSSGPKDRSDGHKPTGKQIRTQHRKLKSG